jgi:hypothetical protein
MFMKLSLVIFLLLGAVTTCWSAGSKILELANIHLQTVPIFYLDRTNFTFGLAMGIKGFGDGFSASTSLQWEDLTLDRVNETIVLDSSNYRPAFDDFCRLLTDGDDMYVEKSIITDTAFYTGVEWSVEHAPRDYEHEMFGDQTGCVNGVDLQGNYIETIALTIDDFESVYYPTLDDWSTKLNLSLVFRGRPLFRNENDLAIYGPSTYIKGVAANNSTRMYLIALNGSRWATLEFIIDWNTAVVGDHISPVREFGTHNIRELITDGDDGYFKVEVPSYHSRRYSESRFFNGQKGCFNDVDLEGNYVQDIWLVLEEGTKYEVWESGVMHFTIKPRFVYSGSLGIRLNGCPECFCECECDDGLPKHTVATTVEILALLTGWAWFLM